MFASGPGQSHTFSVFVGPISKELGITATEIASAYGGATLFAAVCLPLMGRLIDRHGARHMMTIIAILLGCACFAFGLSTGIVWLSIGYASLRFFGQGSLMMGSVNIVSQWFAKRRGFAMSLMGLGFTLSMAIHPPLAQWLIDSFGWRQAWFILGGTTWALLLVPIIFFVINKPEDVGLRPDGEILAADASAADVSSANRITGLTLNQALHTPTFYILSAGMFSLSMLVTSLHFFQVSIFADQGLEPQIASKVFSISAFTMAVCIPLVGRLLDRFPANWIFSGGLIVMACSLVTVTFVNDLPSAIIYAMFFGLNNAVTMTFFSYMFAHYFGRKHIGSVQGAGQMVAVVGASLGPVLPGYGFDYFGEFAPMLLDLAILPATMAFVVLFLRAPKIPGEET
ncbi:MAG: MFS transporter [Rhodospirillales bacterium]|nr:MFS transporter [Rhodospirillales bacterium]